MLHEEKVKSILPELSLALNGKTKSCNGSYVLEELQKSIAIRFLQEAITRLSDENTVKRFYNDTIIARWSENASEPDRSSSTPCIY